MDALKSESEIVASLKSKLLTENSKPKVELAFNKELSAAAETAESGGLSSSSSNGVSYGCDAVNNENEQLAAFFSKTFVVLWDVPSRKQCEDDSELRRHTDATTIAIHTGLKETKEHFEGVKITPLELEDGEIETLGVDWMDSEVEDCFEDEIEAEAQQRVDLHDDCYANTTSAATTENVVRGDNADLQTKRREAANAATRDSSVAPPLQQQQVPGEELPCLSALEIRRVWSDATTLGE